MKIRHNFITSFTSSDEKCYSPVSCNKQLRAMLKDIETVFQGSVHNSINIVMLAKLHNNMKPILKYVMCVP